MATTKKDLEAALVQLVNAVESQPRLPRTENVEKAVADAKALLPDASWTD